MLLLVDLACAQDDVEEQYADIESEKQKVTTLPDPSSAEEKDEEWCHQIPSDKVDVHQCENSQPHNFFLLYHPMMLAVIVQETNRYKQQMHKQEISQVLHILSK
jgi:hypothetical protein